MLSADPERAERHDGLLTSGGRSRGGILALCWVTPTPERRQHAAHLRVRKRDGRGVRGGEQLALHAAAKLHNVTPKPHSRRPLLAGGATPYEAARGAPYDNAKLRHFFGAVAAVRLNATGRPSTLERQGAARLPEGGPGGTRGREHILR